MKRRAVLHPLLLAEGVEWRECHSMSPIGSVDWKGSRAAPHSSRGHIEWREG